VSIEDDLEPPNSPKVTLPPLPQLSNSIQRLHIFNIQAKPLYGQHMSVYLSKPYEKKKRNPLSTTIYSQPLCSLPITKVRSRTIPKLYSKIYCMKPPLPNRRGRRFSLVDFRPRSQSSRSEEETAFCPVNTRVGMV
jgi:hypothetical protein